MRGGVNMEDLLHVYSHDDVEAMMQIIEENIEISKKSQMPLI